tara:strand:+ start:527 stop:712 length:186 start_codon:yes stop_codon:yes gene_type:complete
MANYKQLTIDDEFKRLQKLHDEGRRYSPNEINPIGGSPGKIFSGEKRVEAFKKKTNNSVNA